MHHLVRRPCQAYLLRVKLIESLSSKDQPKVCWYRQISTTKILSTDTDFRPSEELAKERYDGRANEDIEKKRARLLYQSKKRGMLENGVILASFANKFLPEFNAQQLDEYDRLINLPTNDWDIFYWATKTKPTPPEFETPVMAKLREHLKSKVSNLNNSVLGKTKPDDIVLPIIKKRYDLDVDVSEVSLTHYKEELFDERKRTYSGGKQIVNMMPWRKKFFEKRLRRILPAPTSVKNITDDKEPKPYSQRVEKKDIAHETVVGKNMIDTSFERKIKHHNFMQYLLGSELTDKAVDYDDESEAWSEMLWHRNYGLDDCSISPINLQCKTCLSNLHCCDPGLAGYVPKQILMSLSANGQSSEEDIRCQRCKFSRVYNAELSYEVSPEKFEDFLRALSNERSAVICILVDLTDFPSGIWDGMIDLIGQSNKILVVGNKLDLLPYDGFNMIERVRKSLRNNLLRLRRCNPNLNISDVMVMSARTGFNIEALVTKLLDLSGSTKNIYLVGSNNSGKSTLFSALLQTDLCATRKGDILSRVSTFTVPALNINQLKFPINLAEGWEVELKKRRLVIEERKIAIKERSLGSTTRARQATMPHMSTLINRLEYSSPTSADSLVISNETKQGMPRFTEDHPLANLEQKEPLAADETNFKEHKFFHQTPSSTHHDQIHDLLTPMERLEVFPNETIIPRKYSVRPLNTIYIAGLARLDLLTSQSNVLFTIFVSKHLPIHVLPTRKADQFYDNFLGTPYLGIPFGNDDRLASWPRLSNSQPDFNIKGVAQHIGAADIVLSSIGWALINMIQDHECLVRAFTPHGRGIFLRAPPLLSMANRPLGAKIRDTPVFKHPHYITEVRTGQRLDRIV